MISTVVAQHSAVVSFRSQNAAIHCRGEKSASSSGVAGVRHLVETSVGVVESIRLSKLWKNSATFRRDRVSRISQVDRLLIILKGNGSIVCPPECL
jgi:hypothetical protein